MDAKIVNVFGFHKILIHHIFEKFFILIFLYYHSMRKDKY